jgi:hypothetical protein
MMRNPDPFGNRGQLGWGPGGWKEHNPTSPGLSWRDRLYHLVTGQPVYGRDTSWWRKWLLRRSYPRGYRRGR